jgi:hypothetical protein
VGSGNGKSNFFFKQFDVLKYCMQRIFVQELLMLHHQSVMQVIAMSQESCSADESSPGMKLDATDSGKKAESLSLPSNNQLLLC